MGLPTTMAAIRERFENGRLLNDLGLTSDVTPGFESWRQVDADKPALVTIEATVETDGTSAGEVTVAVDEDGGTTADYTLEVADVEPDNATGTTFTGTIATLYLPAGAQYQVQNVSDPNGNNSLNVVREVTL